VPVRPDAEAIAKRYFAGIRNTKDCFFRFIAGRTHIEQVRVLEFSPLILGNWSEMVDVKGRTSAVPLLPMKTVHTPKRELIAEPFAIAVVIKVARWAMPSRVWLGWLLESHHLGMSLPFVALENSLSSSSSSTWVGRGDTLSM
jgi:hypothetical protein